MSSPSSIPMPRPPGKDPPSSSPAIHASPHREPPQINSPTPPTPSNDRHELSQDHPRPSAPRSNTSESLQRRSQHQSVSPPNEQAIPQSRTFAPFFTLIHDPITNSTHHPRRIQYIFSDDDESDLSAACIRSLDAAASSSSTSQLGAQDKVLQSSSTSSSSSATFRKDVKPQIKGKGKEESEERVIIVDMNEAGDAVSSASCLSHKWQILNADIGTAPTYDVGDGNSEADGNGLMLRIEGVGCQATDEDMVGLGLGKLGDSKERRKSGEGHEDDTEMQALLDTFDHKMALLRKIVGAAPTAVELEVPRHRTEEDALGNTDTRDRSAT